MFSRSTSRWISQLPPFARRALQVDQMDLDSALSQMYSLLVSPSLVSKMSKARKMTKNQYHRDDPAFMVLQSFFLILATIANACAFGVIGASTLYAAIYNVVIGYLLTGVLFATITWILVSRFLITHTVKDPSVRREVDWQYAFDIHCNGFFTYFVWARVVPFFLLPVLFGSTSYVSCLIANGLYFFGCANYVYNVFLGYLELPMLAQQQKLMYPIPIIVALYVVFSLLLSKNLIVWETQQLVA